MKSLNTLEQIAARYAPGTKIAVEDTAPITITADNVSAIAWTGI